MTPWTAVQQSDAAAIMAVWAMLAGCVIGAVMVLLFVGWRRLRVPSALREEVRRLRADLDEATITIGHLYAQNDRLARRLVTVKVSANDLASDQLAQARAAIGQVRRTGAA